MRQPLINGRLIGTFVDRILEPRSFVFKLFWHDSVQLLVDEECIVIMQFEMGVY